MQQFALAGTPSEMGSSFAGAVQKRSHSLAAITPESVDPPAATVAFARECVPLVEEHVPELLSEIDAVANGLDADREIARLVALALDADVGCSLVGIAPEHTACDGPLFGRNLDFHPSTQPFAKRYRTDPADRLASVGCGLSVVGRLDGINEAGLAIGFAGVPTDSYVPGIAWPLAIRHVLDTCERVGEATAFLESIPHVRNVNFLVADATGDVAVVEAGQAADVAAGREVDDDAGQKADVEVGQKAAVNAGPELVETRRPADGVAVATNQFAGERMREFQSNDRAPADCQRHRTLTEWAGTFRGSIDLADLQTAMGDPDRGVCWRIDEDGDDPRSTLWSWTVAPGEGVAHLAPDSPTTTPYEPVAIPPTED